LIITQDNDLDNVCQDQTDLSPDLSLLSSILTFFRISV